MKVFKTKWVDKWARNQRVSDSIFLDAAAEILLGKVEVNLGAGLFKKRLARKGGGKSGGYRTIVGYKKSNSDRVIFLYAFGKNERANISEKEKAALKIAAEAFIDATDEEVKKLLKDEYVKEVLNNA